MKEVEIESVSGSDSGKEKSEWFALYTRSKSEKKALKWLEEDGFKVYLPIRKELRQWSDRKKWVEVPLVPSYIFVKVNRKEYFEVLDSPYVVRYIMFEGKPAPVRDHEIEMMKLLLEESSSQAQIITTNIKKGDMVEITGGPMAGAIGEVVYQKGKYKFQVRPEQLGFAVQVEINAAYLKKVAKH